MTPDKMIRMANQIATFFDTQPGDAAGSVADHLAKFWEPRMKAQLFAHAAAGGEGLRDSVREAVARMQAAA
ncbi:MAG: formate dehydrogenase subunit delta [Rubellimicrobium sp.]|nr:formate dehydrogenase subunit delta [Rubellimicrobium sp.]